MRAADQDRERVLEVVRQSHAEGRLSTPEFYERLDAVYRAKTYAELDEVVRDLPAVGAPAPDFAAAPAPAVARANAVGSLARMPGELRGLWVTWATSVAICVLVWRSLTTRQRRRILADLGGRPVGCGESGYHADVVVEPQPRRRGAAGPPARRLTPRS